MIRSPRPAPAPPAPQPPPPAAKTIRVRTASKMKECITAILDHLNGEAGAAEPNNTEKRTVTIIAKNKALTKAVSIVELAKRELGGELKVKQVNEIAYAE
ncbi:hypothetical protein HDU98_001784 [Podochytrium sp. JEL0797]|nr:hypothetical protein HDU98_001784 [Podochytrium sp. JEL0797]